MKIFNKVIVSISHMINKVILSIRSSQFSREEDVPLFTQLFSMVFRWPESVLFYRFPRFYCASLYFHVTLHRVGVRSSAFLKTNFLKKNSQNPELDFKRKVLIV